MTRHHNSPSLEQRSLWGRVARGTSILWVGLLCSCAALIPQLDLPDRDLPIEWTARMSTLMGWERYAFRARVSVTRGEENLTARLTWRQRDGRSELGLSSPLGVGGVNLILDSTLGHSLTEALGVDVPAQSLKHWLLGVPDPILPIGELIFDRPILEGETSGVPTSLPRRLDQAGWQIHFRRYAPVPHTRLVLPSRIDLSRDGIEVRVVIEAWGGVT